jgi:hypothetical protein
MSGGNLQSLFFTFFIFVILLDVPFLFLVLLACIFLPLSPFLFFPISNFSHPLIHPFFSAFPLNPTLSPHLPSSIYLAVLLFLLSLQVLIMLHPYSMDRLSIVLSGSLALLFPIIKLGFKWFLHFERTSHRRCDLVLTHQAPL